MVEVRRGVRRTCFVDEKIARISYRRRWLDVVYFTQALVTEYTCILRQALSSPLRSTPEWAGRWAASVQVQQVYGHVGGGPHRPAASGKRTEASGGQTRVQPCSSRRAQQNAEGHHEEGKSVAVVLLVGDRAVVATMARRQRCRPMLIPIREGSQPLCLSWCHPQVQTPCGWQPALPCTRPCWERAR